MVSERVDSRGSMFTISSADYGLTEIQHEEEFKYSNLLRKCTESSSLRHGRAIDGRFLKTYIHSSLYLHNFLVSMYVKCGDLENGPRLFDEMLQRNVITFVSVLQACSFSSSLILAYQVYGLILKFGLGQCVHGQSLRTGLECDVYLGSSLIIMYVKCGHLNDAWKVFDQMAVRDVSSWNALIAVFDIFLLTMLLFNIFVKRANISTRGSGRASRLQLISAIYNGVMGLCFDLNGDCSAEIDLLFLHGSSDMVLAKQAIFMYYLIDRQWTLPDNEWRYIVYDFAATFGITRHSLLESLTFYLLDDYTAEALQEACRILPEISGPTTHPKVAQVLLEQFILHSFKLVDF